MATATRSRRQTRTANTPGKTMFVKEFLNDHPQSNVGAVNEAWQAAGFEGTISHAVINKMRASLGLTGNLRANTKKSRTSATAEKRGRRRETAAAVKVQPRASNSARTMVLVDLEADIDRLMFKAMEIGNLAELENSLRQARRLLYVTANGR